MIDHQLFSVDQMLFFEIGMTMMKVHNKSFPQCFNEFFPQTSHTMSTRSKRSFNLEKPRIELTKQSLNYKGSLVWNKIPNDVKYIKHSQPPMLAPINSFKNNLRYFVLAEGPMAIGHYLSEILYSNSDI